MGATTFYREDIKSSGISSIKLRDHTTKNETYELVEK